MVGVHIAYVADDFQCLLNSDLYLLEEWAEDEYRRKEAEKPGNPIVKQSFGSFENWVSKLVN